MTYLKRILFTSTIFSLLLFTTSCNKDVDLTQLQESEAVEIIEAAIQDRTQGLMTNVEDIVTQLVYAVASGELCDTMYSVPFSNSYEGTQIQASYNSMFNYEMTCNNFNIPQTATFTSTTETMYNTNRITSSDDGNFSGDAAGLQLSATSMTLEGDYNRTGVQVLEFSEQQNVNSILNMNIESLDIKKQDNSIQSGTGTFTLTGNAYDTDFSYSGSIVFNGDNTATITINGTTYEIDLN